MIKIFPITFLQHESLANDNAYFVKKMKTFDSKWTPLISKSKQFQFSTTIYVVLTWTRHNQSQYFNKLNKLHQHSTCNKLQQHESV